MTQLEVPSLYGPEVDVPPATPSYLNPQSLLRRITLSYAQYARHLAFARDGRVLELGFAVLCDGGYLDDRKNMCVVLEHLNELQLRELAEAAEAFYGKSTTWMLCGVAPQDFQPIGLPRLHADNPVAYLPLQAKALHAARSEQAPTELEIREVSSAEDLYVYEHTRYGARGESGVALPKCGLPDERVLDRTNRFWVGYVGDTPVATGALFEHDGISLMKGLSVLPDFRGRGFARTMMTFRISEAAGIPMVDLDVPARRLAAKMGFVHTGMFGYWTPGQSSYREPMSTIMTCA